MVLLGCTTAIFMYIFIVSRCFFLKLRLSGVLFFAQCVPNSGKPIKRLNWSTDFIKRTNILHGNATHHVKQEIFGYL